MAEPFLGEIRPFAINKTPDGWAPCAGQLLKINDYPTLFGLLGTTYGGDGQITFGLPDLAGRMPVGRGRGTGLENYTLGQKGGQEQVSLQPEGLPPHKHAVEALDTFGSGEAPAGHIIGLEGNYTTYGFDPSEPRLVDMHPEAIGTSGGGQGHYNMQPYQVIRYFVALEGTFPAASQKEA
ncbi:phage tail protein [Candidatus Bipolaricaulota bacterium]